ncbi:MAG: general secretion pathway protein GspC [Myxococcales bacterium]|jgi:general secretion pathway protein C|nr:general secretion pathway protein GspC [Myxococcales bacterium]
MELFFRKYFWVVNLLFLAAAAFFTARIASALVESKLRPPVSGLMPKSNDQVAQASSKRTLSPEALSKLTGIPLPVERLSAEEEEAAARLAMAAAGEVDSMEGEVDEELLRSSLRVKLIGTTLANVSEWSIATLFDMNESKSSVYRVGGKVLDAEIVAIELRRVIVLNNGRREYIDASEPDSGGGMVRPAVREPLKPEAVASFSGIRATSANTYEVPKDELQKALGDMSTIATQARIVPSFKNGESQGFKIFSIKPNSLFTKLGIQNGDVVKRINGFDINSPDKALEIYSKLQSSSRIEIEFERGGSPTRKTYNIR